MTARAVTSAKVVRRVLQLHDSTRPAVALFDGDGTLWSGDVGEDAYLPLVEGGRVRPAAGDALREVARANGVDDAGTPSAIALRVFRAWQAGEFPEDTICEVMAWAWAGHTQDEQRDAVRQALVARGLEARLQREIGSILDALREAGIRTLVVSASPRIVVEEAASYWQFTRSDVIGATPVVEGDVLAARMAERLPYAEGKLVAGRALAGTARWLAAFGDNVFDLDMLRAAEVGVCVRPKPAMRAELERSSDLWVLDG